MPTPLDPQDQTRPQTPSRDDPREAWQAWAQAEFPSAAEAAAEAALNVIDAGGEAGVAVAAAHRAALLRSMSAAPPPAPGPVVSPDGRHWWDGAAWREVAVTPATATAHDVPPPPGQLPLFGPPPPWAPPPPPPVPRHPGRLVGAAVGATAVLAAVAVVAISLVVHRSTNGATAGGGGTVTFAPGSTHCTFRVTADSFSLITDAANAPVDCGTVRAGFEAAEQSVGATVTPIVGLPSGATAHCSHQFGTSGYAVTIYNDPASSHDGDVGQAFIEAACGAFQHVLGGG
jgi:hypothetical protein